MQVTEIYDALDHVKTSAENIQEGDYVLTENVGIPDPHIPYNLFVYLIFMNAQNRSSLSDFIWRTPYTLSEVFLQKFINFVTHYSEEAIWLFFVVENLCFEGKNIEIYLSRTIDLLSNEDSFVYAKKYISEMEDYANISILAYISILEESSFKIQEKDFDSAFGYPDGILEVEIEGGREYLIRLEKTSIIFNRNELFTINGEYEFSYILWEKSPDGKLCFSYRSIGNGNIYLFYNHKAYQVIFPMDDANDYYVDTDETGVYVGYYYISYSSLDEGTNQVYCMNEDGERNEVHIDILIPQGTHISRTSIFDTKYFDIKGRISEDVRFFIEFLSLGGEFLEEGKDKIIFNSSENLLLTDIIGISRNFPEEFMDMDGSNSLHILKNLTGKIQEKLKNRIPFQRNITTTIDGQDRASMVWLREVVQNSRDAILKSKKNDKNMDNRIRIEFYQGNNHWISSVSDSIGMSPKDVFMYLLTPGKSGKEGDDMATGMFGQGFYSLAIGSKEIRVKTGIGDQKTMYIKLIPVYNDNKDIIDFKIDYNLQDEQFKGTIIERVDNSEGIGGNIGALIGIQNLKKYVGNLDDVNILYNGNGVISGEDVVLLETENIPDIGVLSLKRNKDQYERLTKDNLFISEIKDIYIGCFPDWMKAYIKSNNYSLDLPSKMELTKTRNALTDFEKNIEILIPHIFNIFCRQIIKDYLLGKVKIPMMPLDYYGLDYYENKFNHTILGYTKRVNNGGVLKVSEMETLKDKNNMIQYLINLKVLNAGEYITIRYLKSNRDDQKKVKKHTQNAYAINHKAETRNGLKQEINIENDSEKIEFIRKIKERFDPVIQRIFGFGIEFGFLSGVGWDACAGDGTIYFNANMFESIKIYGNVKLIQLISHEMTHLVEPFIKEMGINFEEEVVENGKNLKTIVGSHLPSIWNEKVFGTHQKDLEHEHSFERIQRQILKIMTREHLG